MFLNESFDDIVVTYIYTVISKILLALQHSYLYQITFIRCPRYKEHAKSDFLRH